MVGVSRGMYAMSERNEGPKPNIFGRIDKTTNMTTNSAIYGLFICSVWLVYFYGANLTDNGWFGLFDFDSSELPIITIYAMYIPIFVSWMIKEKELGIFKRFILPLLSVLACVFTVFCAIYAHGIVPYLNALKLGKFSFPVLFYLIVFMVIMIIGAFFKNPKDKNKLQ
jgi:APA family basic amino acid/polyamine antiporter